MANLPYAQLAGTLVKMLEKIKIAAVPERFSQDFVSTKLGMKGGTPRSTIPFIKKMGLVAPDGTPTDRYREFRNPDKSGAAIADSMRELYSNLFEMNEYVYELDQSALKKLIVEATGAEKGSSKVQKTVATFTALNDLADFEEEKTTKVESTSISEAATNQQLQINSQSKRDYDKDGSESINLSYTINLNLPATTDVEVFNAIFSSLKKHLLQE